MSNFHPDLDILAEYAAGSLALALAACVAVHLHHCAHCQRLAEEFTELGANFFEALTPFPVGDIDLHAVLARLDEEPAHHYRKQGEDADDTAAILQRLMRGDFFGLKWTSLNADLRVSYLRTGDPSHEFALYHMRAGGRIPQHNHRGTEVTLVLAGGVTDGNGTYHKGDFLMRKPGDVHAPTALQTEECYCLLALDAPLKFTGWRHRWLNPFLKLNAI